MFLRGTLSLPDPLAIENKEGRKDQSNGTDRTQNAKPSRKSDAICNRQSVKSDIEREH
jgi:hypothetical protein